MRRNRFIYGIYLLTILYISMIYYNYGLYVILYLSLIPPVVSFLYLLLLRRRVSFTWARTEVSVARGSETEIILSLRNESLLPTGVTEIRYSVTDSLTDSVDSQKKKTVIGGNATATERLVISMKRTGTVVVSVDSVRVCEPLGLFSYTLRRGAEPVSYTILPVLSVPESTLWEHNPYAYVEEDVYSDVKPGDDPSELFGTREYIPGDRLNRIHWNLTVKQDDWIVKQLGLPIDCSTVLLLEMYSITDEDALNALFDAAFSLSLKLAIDGHRHWFSWYDEEHGVLCREMVESEEQVYALISNVLGCRLYGSGRSVITEYRAQYPREQYRNLFYVTDDLRDEDRELLRAERGDAYVICYTTGGEAEETTEGEWKERFVRASHIAEDLGAEEGSAV